MNDGITRSGSFGPAAELAAAHTEIERLKAWSNEQIAKLAAHIVELEGEVTRWREAWAKAQVQVDTKASPLGDEGPDHGEADPDYPPHRYLFEGEPEKRALCGEAGHVHDDHFSPPLAKRLAAAEAKIAKLEKALELQKRIGGGFSGALMAAEQRLDAAAELVKKTDPWQPLGTIHDKLLALIDQAAPLADDEWKELDPERTHDRDDCDNPDCGTCMFNAADEWKELDPER